jgi:polysaccharide biosynthesis protein PslG
MGRASMRNLGTWCVLRLVNPLIRKPVRAPTGLRIAVAFGVLYSFLASSSNASSRPLNNGPAFGNEGSRTIEIHKIVASVTKAMRLNASDGFGMAVPSLARQSARQQNAWLTDMKSVGITWIRIDIDWATVQPGGPRSYDWSRFDRTLQRARMNGIKVLGIIDYAAPWARRDECASLQGCPPANYAAYARYAKAVVKHFGSLLSAVEIWNEPNATHFWMKGWNATDYVSMLKRASAAIRSVNPSLPIVSAGLAQRCDCDGNISPLTFTRDMYDAGAKSAFDALGYHPYTFPALPSDDKHSVGWSQMNRTKPSLRSIMAAAGDGGKKIWLTEMGAPTGGPGARATCTDPNFSANPDHVNDCLQNRIITQEIGRAKSQKWIGPAFIYSYKDEGEAASTSENHFGIVRADGSRKAAHAGVRRAIAGR